MEMKSTSQRLKRFFIYAFVAIGVIWLAAYLLLPPEWLPITALVLFIIAAGVLWIRVQVPSALERMEKEYTDKRKHINTLKDATIGASDDLCKRLKDAMRYIDPKGDFR